MSAARGVHTWACDQINTLAGKAESTAGLYFVIAFNGLLAPYWDPGVGGLIIGASVIHLVYFVIRSLFVCYRLDPIHNPSAHCTRNVRGKRVSSDTSDSRCYEVGLESRPEAPEGRRRNDQWGSCDAGARGRGWFFGLFGLRCESLCPHDSGLGSSIIERTVCCGRSTALGPALLVGSAIGFCGWDINNPETVAGGYKGQQDVHESIPEADKERQYKGWERAVERAKGRAEAAADNI
jgi:glycerol kinase